VVSAAAICGGAAVSTAVKNKNPKVCGVRMFVVRNFLAVEQFVFEWNLIKEIFIGWRARITQSAEFISLEPSSPGIRYANCGN
jgi:hypothetical protein